MKNNVKYKKTAFWSICIIFILLAGLRYRIGGDTLAYMELWKYYPDFWNFNWFSDIESSRESNPEMERFQIGWFLFVMFVRGICTHQVFIQLVVATLLNYSIFRTVNKYSKYPFITILVYYFNFKFFEFEFEIMRESVAVSIFLLFAYDNYVQKKWLKYFIATLAAYFVHPSAIFMFFLPFFRNLNISLIKGTILFVIPPILIGVAGRILLGDLINVFFNTEGDSATYIMNATEKDFNTNYALTYLLQPFALYLLLICYYHRLKNSIYLSLILITIFFSNLSLLVYTSSRLVNYIIIPVYIGVTPLFFSLINKFKSIFIVVLLLLVYNFQFLYRIKYSTEVYAKYFPYQNYIFPSRTPEQKNIDKLF